MFENFIDTNCPPSFFFADNSNDFDFAPISSFSVDTLSIPEKRPRDGTSNDDDEKKTCLSSFQPPKKRVQRPESSQMDTNVTNRDPEFEMWCVDDLRNPKESGVSRNTLWKSLEEAQKHACAVVEDTLEQSTDIPQDVDSKRAIVHAIKAAMWSTAYALDGKDTIRNHEKNRRDTIFEYHAWHLLELLIQRQKFGQLSLFEPIYKPPKISSPQTFNEELDSVLYTLTAHKSIVKRIIARPANRVFIDNPRDEGARVLANRTLNKKKGVQIAQAKRAYSV